MLTSWAGIFPLPTPTRTRPTLFPLSRPSLTGTMVAWGDQGQQYEPFTVPPGLSDVLAIYGTPDSSGFTPLKSDGKRIFDWTIAIQISRLRLDMGVLLGRTYQLQASNDLKV